MTRKTMLRRLRRGDDPLMLSIRKWEDIVKGTGKDEGNGNCALCARFRADDCVECPVQEHTGESGCSGTPYEDFKWAEGATYHSLEAALQELTFLKSLSLSLKRSVNPVMNAITKSKR